MMKLKEGIKSNCDGVQLALPILYLMMSTMKKERCAESDVQNLFKVNNKYTRVTSISSQATFNCSKSIIGTPEKYGNSV